MYISSSKYPLLPLLEQVHILPVVAKSLCCDAETDDVYSIETFHVSHRLRYSFIEHRNVHMANDLSDIISQRLQRHR